MRIAFLLPLILLVAGCTASGEVVNDESPDLDTLLAEELANVPEPKPMEEELPEEPEDLPKPVPDPCSGVYCQARTMICPDGILSTCQEQCENSTCVSCFPSCSGHNAPCQPVWSCLPWSGCLDGISKRTCIDINRCDSTNDKPAELAGCTIPEPVTPPTNTTENTTSQNETNETVNVTFAIFLSAIQCDAPGNDAVRENWPGEWVAITNNGTEQNLTNWTVHDADGNVYNLTNFTFPENWTILLHSGTGDDNATDLFWGKGPIWNNDDDTAFLVNATNETVSELSC